ncbi:MAG: hypothetical protein VKP72_07315 [bacterium]|nr:hypothetical protein [bacterium]
MPRLHTVHRLIPVLILAGSLTACPGVSNLLPPPGEEGDGRTNALPTASPDGDGGLSGGITDTSDPSVHSGPITGNVTWTKANSPHIVTDYISVGSASGATLTIEPGVEVRFDPRAGISFGESNGATGILKAVGTATESIRFTSRSAIKQSGSWEQLAFFNGSAGSVLEHVTLAYGGGTQRGRQSSMLWLHGEGARPAVRNCTFEHARGTAILAENDATFAAFENNTIREVQDLAMVLGAEAAGSLGAGNTFTTIGNPHIGILPTSVTRDTRWRNHGIPYLIENEVTVEGLTAPVLTLDPGSTLKFASGGNLYVGWSTGTSGALQAVGTASSSITFTGVSAEKGAWNHLGLGPGSVTGSLSNPRSTVLKHVRLQYGGGQAKGSLYILNSQPLLQNVTIDDSASHGLFAEGDDTSSIPSQVTLESGVTGSRNDDTLIFRQILNN